MFLMPNFSINNEVNQQVYLETWFMGAQPYDFDAGPVRDAPMTVADVIEKIRRHFGDAAAKSITITMH